ncbi:MAG: circularly permuted type 2 ATP-grasp protein [Pirellulaceae bacterium]|nr:circularly permuted type 2 ATP-grasp protein [Pirellulaceae bacterium]
MTDSIKDAHGAAWQLLDYQPVSHAYDEAIDAAGNLRGHWKTLIVELESLGRGELDRRWRQGLDQIQRDGVTFNPYDAESGSSRPWALDPIPMVFDELEWSSLAAGIEQRARLMDGLLADLFGPQRLLREKIIPPELYYDHPAVYPAYHQLQVAGRNYLSLYAMDLGRAPDGRWISTGDRTRAPFGLGYVLENRFAASRIFPAMFRRGKIRRIASFFASLRQGLVDQAWFSKDNPRIVLLTKGPGSRAYFEDAYLARYLGFLLAEGGDLAVRDQRVMLKTLGGLLPVEVILRRTDDDACDPIELSGCDMNGVAGLVESCRNRQVAIANALGSQVVESPVFLPWLPAICEFLLSEELRLPTIPTWWCGQQPDFAFVQDNLDQLIIRRAYRTDADEAVIRPAQLTGQQREQLVDQLMREPHRFVAQQGFVRSTVPVWTEDGAQPWHLAIRAFACAGQSGYSVLPGGLARISPDSNCLDSTMTSGERSQDVWVIAGTPVKDVKLTPLYSDHVELRRSGPDLPSRAADNLFWLGRYMGRIEGSVRLLREVFQLMSSEQDRSDTLEPLLRTLVDLGQIEPDYVISEFGGQLPGIENALPLAIFDVSRERSLRSSVQQAARVIATLPDRITADMSRSVRRLDAACQLPDQRQASSAQVLAMLDELLIHALAFDGLVNESMTRGFSWLFLDLGLRIERCWQAILLLESTAVRVTAEESGILESLLQVGGNVMTYRSRYLSNLQMAPLLDLLLCDETNPRSIAFQLVRIERHVNGLPRTERYGVKSPEQLLALSMLSEIRLTDVFLITRSRGQRREELARLLERLRVKLPKLSEIVSGRYLIHAGLPRSFTEA